MEMGFVMQCLTSAYAYSICVPHRFPKTPLSLHREFNSVLNSHNTINSASTDTNFVKFLSFFLSFSAFGAYHWNGFKGSPKNHRMVLSAVEDRNSNIASERKRYCIYISLGFNVLVLELRIIPI